MCLMSTRGITSMMPPKEGAGYSFIPSEVPVLNQEFPTSLARNTARPRNSCLSSLEDGADTSIAQSENSIRIGITAQPDMRRQHRAIICSL